jgi:hypothetical protein
MLKINSSKETGQISVIKDSSKINGDDLNNIILKANRQFRNKRRESLKDKFSKLATNRTNKTIGVNEFKRVCGNIPHSNNRQVLVSRKRLVDFMSMVT